MTRITGTIIDFDTNQPIANAHISQGNYGNLDNYVYSDANGRFSIDVENVTYPLAVWIDTPRYEQPDGTRTTFWSIPTPPPANWYIYVSPKSSTIAVDENFQGTTGTVNIFGYKIKAVPFYAGLGLLALLLLTRKKKKGRKR